MKILYTAFKGKTNSSKILLDKIDTRNKLYLTNSFITSVLELENELKKNQYDLIISIGQEPIRCDNVKIEEIGVNDTKYKTNYDYTNIKLNLEKRGYKVIISNDERPSLCNNLYFHGLKFISDNNLKTKMIFIHIPKLKNITNINNLVNSFIESFF